MEHEICIRSLQQKGPQGAINEINVFASKQKSKEKYCCKNPPPINIETDHIILDELHLILRIMDVLFGNLIKDVICCDQQENWLKKTSENESLYFSGCN